MYAHTPHTEALQTGTVDKPSGGQLAHAVRRNRIYGTCGVFLPQTLCRGVVDNGILEETAGIAKSVGVGQFAAAYGADGITYVCD